MAYLDCLPWEARVTLRYGWIDKTGMQAMLLPDMRLEKETTYPVGIALGEHPLRLKEFLEHQIPRTTADSEMIEYISKTIGSLPDPCRVAAIKLVPISWFGFGHWQRQWLSASCRYLDGVKPVLAGYPSLVGIHHILSSGYGCYFLIPDWIRDSENPACGFDLSDEKGALFIPKGIALSPNNVVIIDDPLNAGTDGVTSYLISCGQIKISIHSLSSMSSPRDRAPVAQQWYRRLFNGFLWW